MRNYFRCEIAPRCFASRESRRSRTEAVLLLVARSLLSENCLQSSLNLFCVLLYGCVALLLKPLPHSDASGASLHTSENVFIWKIITH